MWCLGMHSNPGDVGPMVDQETSASAAGAVVWSLLVEANLRNFHLSTGSCDLCHVPEYIIYICIYIYI